VCGGGGAASLSRVSSRRSKILDCWLRLAPNGSVFHPDLRHRQISRPDQRRTILLRPGRCSYSGVRLPPDRAGEYLSSAFALILLPDAGPGQFLQAPSRAGSWIRVRSCCCVWSTAADSVAVVWQLPSRLGS
jgi:hypothetical protein